MGQKRVLVTREPEQFKAILATKFDSFGHCPQWHKLWRPFLGDGIFATDGQQLQHRRWMVRPMVVKNRLSNLILFGAYANKLLSKLLAQAATVDLKDPFYRWALGTTTDFLLPVAPLIPKGDYYRAIRKMEESMEPFLAGAIALVESELEKLSQSDMQFTIARISKDPKTIRDQVMSVLLAGRDTTAATMSWAMYGISNYPAAWARVRREVFDVLGPNEKPTYEALEDLKYVKNVIDKTMRLLPAVLVNMRQALETTTIPGAPGERDIVLLQGDRVTINTLGMHARRDLYPRRRRFADPAIYL
ncbi:Cytochrome P450 alkane hydroxylase [Tolypocladium capitatum]|uniref:Cytochrome P450 alkane hydroxylase n=1 Tax=Tolypocladium capitatum TaxID=45235 RepID=A0A2K3QKX9_9HYPO|nr:Cytochrome P450 alkane hydroxylase [Tolypocladium capitatum]